MGAERGPHLSSKGCHALPSVRWGKVQKQKASYCKSREGRMQWSGGVVRRSGGPRRGLPGDCDAELTALGGQLQLASNTPKSHRLASFQVYDLREVPWGTGWAEGLPLIVGEPGAHLDPAGHDPGERGVR